MPLVCAKRLEALAASLFAAAGAPLESAQNVARHLVEANLAGHDSHGVMRIGQYLAAIADGLVAPAAIPQVVVEHSAAAVVDGRSGFGQVVAQKAMGIAVDKARKTGIAAVASRNCYHSGRLGSYTAWAARQGMIGIAMVNAGGGGQTVAPFGGLARRLATNPLSIGAPCDGQFPLLLDIATSVAPEGKVRAHHLQGQQVPAGWIIDADGEPTTDPAQFYQSPSGALLPLGGAAGYKGFGLALMIDILAGALSGAGCCRDEIVAPSDGVLLIAIDVTRFLSREAFGEHVRGLVEYVRSCPPAPGFERVMVPGEPEYECEQVRTREGIPLDNGIWETLNTLAAKWGVTAEVAGYPFVDGKEREGTLPATAAVRSAAS